MHMSAHGRQLLTEWEGKRYEVYHDVGGKPTIGVGHLLQAGESFPFGIDDEKIDMLLTADLRVAEDALNSCGSALTQNQFDALCSFIFNIGVSNFVSSTLKKDLLANNLADIPTQLMRWNKVAGEKNEGLVNRRAKELALWKS